MVVPRDDPSIPTLPDLITGFEDTPLVVTLSASDVDTPQNSLVAFITALPSYVTVYQYNGAAANGIGAVISAPGIAVTDSQKRVVFVPDPDWNGYTSFTYVVYENGVPDSISPSKVVQVCTKKISEGISLKNSLFFLRILC